MRIVARFNFIDWKGDAQTGDVWQSQVSGEFIPDSVLGMGKNYSNVDVGVADYLRRMGADLVGAIITGDATVAALGGGS